MGLTLVTVPESLPVALADAKAQARVDYGDDDDLITSAIKTAVAKLDGQSGLLGRCLMSQTWRLSLDRFSHVVEVPLPPCLSVDSVSYLNSAGDEVTLDPATYRVTGIGSLDGARIRCVSGAHWPQTFEAESAFVAFTAGFGETVDDVPPPLITAMKMHVAHLYENRESITSGTLADTPQGYDDLIRDYRTWCF